MYALFQSNVWTTPSAQGGILGVSCAGPGAGLNNPQEPIPAGDIQVSVTYSGFKMESCPEIKGRISLAQLDPGLNTSVLSKDSSAELLPGTAPTLALCTDFIAPLCDSQLELVPALDKNPISCFCIPQTRRYSAYFTLLSHSQASCPTCVTYLEVSPLV